MKTSLLPFYLWKKGSIICNGEKSDYEYYLVDFINASKKFMRITNDKKVIYMKDQSAGEWDCYLDDSPFLDFKLLCSEKMQKELSKVSNRFVYEGNDVYSIIKPKCKYKGDGFGSKFVDFFRDKTTEQLRTINNCNEIIGIDSLLLEDIKSILEVVSTDKKCLFLFSDFFILEEMPREDVYKEIIDYFNENLGSLFRFRDGVVKQDTYIAFFLPRYEVIAFCEWDGNVFKLFDEVPFSCSNSFMSYMKLVFPNDFIMEIVKNRSTF